MSVRTGRRQNFFALVSIAVLAPLSHSASAASQAESYRSLQAEFLAFRYSAEEAASRIRELQQILATVPPSRNPLDPSDTIQAFTAASRSWATRERAVMIGRGNSATKVAEFITAIGFSLPTTREEERLDRLPYDEKVRLILTDADESLVAALATLKTPAQQADFRSRARAESVAAGAEAARALAEQGRSIYPPEAGFGDDSSP